MYKPNEQDIEITQDVLDFFIEYFKINEPYAKNTIAEFESVRDAISVDLLDEIEGF